MPIYFMFNKPMGYITARRDPRHRTVMDLFPEELRDSVFPVGRLDKDTEGLLIVTDDGAMNHELLTPESHIEKSYLFYSVGNIDGERLALLSNGAKVFPTKDYVTAPAMIKIIRKTTLAEVSDELSPEFRAMAQKRPGRDVTIGEITITEGKKHQVKHMVAFAGGKVIYLRRIAMGKLLLDDDLEKGKYRPLTDNEILLLKERTENAL